MRRFLISWLVLAGAPALAGPPFVTDDPEPVEYQHYEINTAMQATYTKDGRAGAWPTIDSNYGAMEGVQLHVGLYASFAKGEDESFHYGDGDTEIGVKIRFIDEDDVGWRPQVAIYPITQFATGDADKGLGAGHQRTILPVWVQKSWGDWTSYGGVGYWLNRHEDTDRNFWFMGWVLMRKISEEWSLGGELLHQTADTFADHASTGFNLGGYYNFDETDHLIFTFGRGVQNAAETNTFSYYVGYQLQF
jgi:hypothetical protein